MVQQADGWADEGPAAVIPAGAYPLVLVGVALSGLTLDQNHVEVFLGTSESLGQNAAVALVHKKQDSSRPTAGQVSQQLIH